MSCPIGEPTLADSRIDCTSWTDEAGLVHVDHSRCGRFASCHMPPSAISYHSCRYCRPKQGGQS